MPELLNISEFLASLSEQARTLLQADTASIWLRDGDRIVLTAAAGYPPEAVSKEFSYSLSDGVTGWIAQGHSFRGDWDALRKHPSQPGKWDDLQWHKAPQFPLSFLGIPIRSDDKTIGVLKVEVVHAGRQFNEADQRLLETVAQLIATALSTRRDLTDVPPRPYVFVLMPFADEFRDVYDLGIKATAEDLGLRCERVDDIEFNDAILAEIYGGIERADLVVADMTGRNPNVFYEVGYAHALSKDVVLLTQVEADIPFDLKGHNHIIYGSSIRNLRELLRRRLQALLDKMGRNDK